MKKRQRKKNGKEWRFKNGAVLRFKNMGDPYMAASRSGKTNCQLAAFLFALNCPQWRVDEILEGKIDND